MPKGDKFPGGALVFAKVKGYPPWPARITGIVGKDRYKVYFYGTYETATLKSEDIWLYSSETKEKFAPKNLKRKGYTEGLDQIEHTPEIAAVDDDALDLGEDFNSSAVLDTSLCVDSTTPTAAKKKSQQPLITATTSLSAVKKEEKTPKSVKKVASESLKKPVKAESPQPAEVTPVSRAKKAVAAVEQPAVAKSQTKGKNEVARVASAASPAVGGTPTRPSSGRGEKRKVEADSGIESPRKKSAPVETAALVNKNAAASPVESSAATEKVVSRSGRLIKPKKFDDDSVVAANSPSRTVDTDSEDQVENGEEKYKKSVAVAVKKEKNSVAARSPAVCVVGAAGDGPTKNSKIKSLVKTEAKVLPMTPEQEKQRKLEKRKNKLRWLKIEQRLVELDIAVKSSLHLERPSPDRCISALEELNELSLAPFMLKKQPDIVTTIRRLRKYIGPQAFNNWPDQEARTKMQKSIETIQQKADQIYNKFKSYFACQGEKPFSQLFEQEVEEFRKHTLGMDESKVLSMIRDPTRPVSADNPSDEDD